MQGPLALGLFLVVLVLVIVQPKGLGIGWPTAVGAVLAVLLGVVSLRDVGTVVSIVWNATLTFVGVILISLVLDGIGFFRWAALAVAKRAGSSGPRLFVSVLVLGAIVAALFANDGAALILTPIVYEQVTALRMDHRAVLAFVMAGGFIADATSLPLVISNLVNIVSADFFHIGFATYAVRMMPVDVLSLVLSIVALWLLFGRDVPREIPVADLPSPASAIRDPVLFHASFWVLGALLLGYFLTEVVPVPVSVLSLGGAALLLYLARRRGGVDVPDLIRRAPWRIVVFSIGMYVVVFGLRDAGLISGLAHLLRSAAKEGPLTASVAGGFLAAVLSAIMNNMPTVLVEALAIHAAHVGTHMTSLMAFANVIGSDLGPKLTPIGSLATLLWLHVLERRGLRIGWGYYMRIGALLTVPVLFLVLCGWTGVWLWHA